MCLSRLAQGGEPRSRKRGVTWENFGRLNASRAAAFWSHYIYIYYILESLYLHGDLDQTSPTLSQSKQATELKVSIEEHVMSPS